MDPKHRIVTHIPLTELWNDQGRLDAPRGGRIGSAEIQQLLHGELAFVIADVGLPLQWVHGKDVFSFWKSEVKPRLVEPTTLRFRLGDFAGSYCYSATHWAQANGSGIVLFEKHH